MDTGAEDSIGLEDEDEDGIEDSTHHMDQVRQEGEINSLMEQINDKEAQVKFLQVRDPSESKEEIAQMKMELSKMTQELKQKRKCEEKMRQELAEMESINAQETQEKLAKEKELKKLETEMAKLHQKCCEQEKKLKLRTAQDEKIKMLRTDIERMKKDKVDMVKKKREDSKRYELWKSKQLQDMNSMNRERSKLSKKVQSLQKDDAHKDAQLAKREKLIQDAKNKIKHLEKQLVQQAKNIVRQSRGNQSQAAKQIQTEMLEHEKRVRQQEVLLKYKMEVEELNTKIHKNESKLARCMSNIPDANGPPTPGLKDVYAKEVENLKAEYQWKMSKVMEMEKKFMEPPVVEDTGKEMTMVELKEYQDQLWKTLIAESQKSVTLQQQLRICIEQKENMAKENKTLRNKLKNQKSEDAEAIENGYEREKKKQELVLEQHNAVSELLCRVKSLSSDIEKLKAENDRIGVEKDEVEKKLDSERRSRKHLEQRQIMDNLHSKRDDSADEKRLMEELQELESRNTELQKEVFSYETKISDMCAENQKLKKKVKSYETRSKRLAADRDGVVEGVVAETA